MANPQSTKGVEETTQSVEETVRDIRRKTRKKYSAEEKVRIVLEGLQGEEKMVRRTEPLSRRSAVGKASTRTCITNGPKNFWKQASGG